MGAEVQTRTSYTLEQVEAGLMELASWHGNSRQAARTLAESGLEVPRGTLEDWKRTHAQRYEEIQETIVPQIREYLAAQQEQIARRSAEVTLQALEQMGEKVEKVEPRDLAGTIRNLSTTSAIGVDKASLLRGLPTEIHDKQSFDEVMKELGQKYPGLIVEGTAEEIPEPKAIEQAAEGSGAVGAIAADTDPKRAQGSGPFRRLNQPPPSVKKRIPKP